MSFGKSRKRSSTRWGESGPFIFIGKSMSQRTQRIRSQELGLSRAQKNKKFIDNYKDRVSDQLTLKIMKNGSECLVSQFDNSPTQVIRTSGGGWAQKLDNRSMIVDRRLKDPWIM
jgi:hypothetical protein